MRYVIGTLFRGYLQAREQRADLERPLTEPGLSEEQLAQMVETDGELQLVQRWLSEQFRDWGDAVSLRN